MPAGSSPKKLKTGVFKKLETLEEIVQARQSLVAGIVYEKERTQAAHDAFQRLKADLHRIIKGDRQDGVYTDALSAPREKKLSSSVVASAPQLALEDSSSSPEPALQADAGTMSRKVVDATNLCLLFKACQPFLDRNVPHEKAEAVLDSILHPDMQPLVYQQFTLAALNGPALGTRIERRRLMTKQFVEALPDGGIPEARLKIAGRNGALNPTSFKAILRHLTEQTIDDALVRALFSHLDGDAKPRDQTVDAQQFLDCVDLVLLHNKPAVVDRCFSVACAEGSAVLCRGDIFSQVVPSGRLTANQAQCLVDHMPQPVKQRLPGLRRSRNPDKARQQESEACAAVVKRYKMGVTMTRKQFEVVLGESPYLVICFLDPILRVVANECARKRRSTGSNSNKIIVSKGPPRQKSLLECLGPMW
ncbi:hypothetical protein DIPPA_31969 [Diplonema papillatum]|nr:hypothetical protein DIPPA_31969 [Diplonema papillatum]